MSKLFGVYSKKELLALIDKSMSDNDVAMFSSFVSGLETKPKKKITNIGFDFFHEGIKNADGLNSLMKGNIIFSLIISKNPGYTISDDYVKKLKENDGVYGFTEK